MLRIISCIVFSCLAYAATAADIPDFSANYQVELNGIQAGELKRNLSSQEDGLRRFQSVSQAKGVFSFFKPDVVEETSVWTLNQGRVTPQQYRYQRSGGKKEKNLSMQFDWASKQVHIDDQKQPWTLELETGVLDKLVYQISLMRDLAKGIEAVNYRIADGGRLKTYKIRVLAEERIITPLGEINTVKLTRERDQDSDRQTTLWCAPALNYLPVKLEHVEDDTRFTALLRRLQGIDSEAAFTPIQSASAIKEP